MACAGVVGHGLWSVVGCGSHGVAQMRGRFLRITTPSNFVTALCPASDHYSSNSSVKGGQLFVQAALQCDFFEA